MQSIENAQCIHCGAGNETGFSDGGQYHAGRSQVFERRADRLEQRDFLRRLPSGNLLSDQLRHFAQHMVALDGSRAQRLDQVTGLGQGAGEGVDEHAGTCHSGVIGLAHVGFERAHQVEVGARLQPLAQHHWRVRGRHAADDVGGLHAFLQVFADLHRQAFIGQYAGQCRTGVWIAAPDSDLRQLRAQRVVGPGHPSGQMAAAHDQQLACIGPGQVTCRQHRCCSGAPQCQRLAVEHGQHAAGGAFEQQVGRLHRGRISAGIARHHCHELDADRITRPCRHQQQGIRLAELVRMPYRYLCSMGKCLRQLRNQCRPGQGGMDLLGAERLHRLRLLGHRAGVRSLAWQ